MGNLNGFGGSGGSSGVSSRPLDSAGDPSLKDFGAVEVPGQVPAPEGTGVDCLEPCVEVLPSVDTDGDVIGEVNDDVIGEVNGDVIGEANDDVIGEVNVNTSCHTRGITGNLSGDVIDDINSDVTTGVTTDVVMGGISDLRVNIDEVDRSSSATIPLPSPTSETTEDNGDERTRDAQVEPEAVGISRASSRSSRDQANPSTLIESGADSSSTTTTTTTTVAQEDIATSTPPETSQNLDVPAVRVGKHAWGTAGLDWVADDALSGVNDPGTNGFDDDSPTRTEAEWIGEEVREGTSELSKSSSSSYHQHGSREFEGTEMEKSIHTEERFGGPEAASSAVYDTLQLRAAREFVDQNISQQQHKEEQRVNQGIDPVQGDGDYYEGHPAGNMPHSDLHLSENGDLRRLEQQQQHALHGTPQRGDSGVGPVVSSAQEMKHEGEAVVWMERTASSRASGAPEWGETRQGGSEARASFGARELLENRDAFGGSEGKETASEPVGGIFGKSEAGSQRCVCVGALGRGGFGVA